MTTNSERQDVAQAGQMYDTSPHLIISVKNTDDTLEFGNFVVNDSGTIVKWNSDDYANKKPVGVVLYNALEIDNKPSKDSKIPIISKGTVWVGVDETDAGFANIKKGEIAYLNAVNGEATGFIDDVITNEKVGVFLEDASELNTGGYIVPIELKLFAKNTNNLIIIDSGNDDPPLPSSGSIIYYNTVDETLRSSSASGWHYLNPKPYYGYSLDYIEPGNGFPTYIDNTLIFNQFDNFYVQNGPHTGFHFNTVGPFIDDGTAGTIDDRYTGIEYTGKYSILCKVSIFISCYSTDATDSRIEIQASSTSGASGLDINGSNFFMNLKSSQESTSGTNFTTNLSPGNKIFIQARALSGSQNITVTSYSITCTTISAMYI